MLAQVLGDPALVEGFDHQQWEQLMSEARYARLMARLWETLGAAGHLGKAPEAFAEGARGACIYSSFLQRRARYEIEELSRQIKAVDYPVVLLKGAAYIVEGNSAAPGRSLSDIDLLVPKDALADFEQRLSACAWKQTAELSVYDEFYYREYSHELPPRRNDDFHYELDVHHNILQPTHRFSVDAQALLKKARPLGDTMFFALSREDQILHSATHLIMSDELRGGLRDMHDISLLYRDGCSESSHFAAGLVARAFELGLERALYYALDCAITHLRLAFPADDWGRLASAAPSTPVDSLMRRLIRHKLISCGAPSAGATRAEQLLYLRSHWIRMPPGLLARHLTRKLFQGKRTSQFSPKSTMEP